MKHLKAVTNNSLPQAVFWGLTDSRILEWFYSLIDSKFKRCRLAHTTQRKKGPIALVFTHATV